MRRFIRKVTFFLLPVLILSFFIDYGISHLLRQSDDAAGEYEVWSDIYGSRINCDVAIYGSSRAWVHISPQILQDSLGMTAYNLGIDGLPFKFQYLRHLEFLKHNKKPKKIILSLDATTLQTREDIYNLEQFLPFMLWNDTIRRYTQPYTGFRSTDYYLPLVRYAGRFAALSSFFKVLFTGTPSKKARTNGYSGMERAWNADFDNALKKTGKYEVKIDTATCRLFEQFVSECRHAGIELILVYTPEYVKVTRILGNRDEILTIYRNYARDLHLPFYDYSADSLCLDRSLFYNSMHLNKRGSELFSRKFAHDLKYID